MTLDDMYQITTDTQREAGPKMKQTIAAVQPEKEEEEIAAFQKRKNKNFNQKRNFTHTASNATTRTGYKGNIRISTFLVKYDYYQLQLVKHLFFTCTRLNSAQLKIIQFSSQNLTKCHKPIFLIYLYIKFYLLSFL